MLAQFPSPSTPNILGTRISPSNPYPIIYRLNIGKEVNPVVSHENNLEIIGRVKNK